MRLTVHDDSQPYQAAVDDVGEGAGGDAQGCAGER